MSQNKLPKRVLYIAKVPCPLLFCSALVTF